MAAKPTPATWMAGTEVQACFEPALLGNVLRAGEICTVTQLHRPRARTPRTWRAHLSARSSRGGLNAHISIALTMLAPMLLASTPSHPPACGGDDHWAPQLAVTFLPHTSYPHSATFSETPSRP